MNSTGCWALDRKPGPLVQPFPCPFLTVAAAAPTWLSRKRASEGLYPAVDPLASASVMLTPAVVGQRHYDIARAVRRTLAEYEDLRDIIAMLGMEELSAADRATVARAPARAFSDPALLHHRLVYRHRWQAGVDRRHPGWLRDDSGADPV